MFKRKALNWLNSWKYKSGRKPLVIRGARQVGKTSLVNEFGKQFDLYISLNLELSEDLAIFQREIDVEELFELILAIKNKSKSKGTTLLFIDEIQNSPLAIKMLRYFYEKMSHIHVIAAGSLLETMINREVSFPVGRVEYMALRPCSFYEFLGAIGETTMQERLQDVSVGDLLHSKMTSLFNKYVLVGGMPQAVADYAENRDIVAIDGVYQSLLAGYADDVEKYKSGESSRNVLRFIISKGWKFASERITFERFANSNYKSREIGEAFRILQKTMLLELSYPTTETKLPIVADMRKKPKLLWLDTGLLNYAAGIQSELFGKDDINDAWRGKIAEHIVGQEILSASNKFLDERSFWVREARNAQAEVDYLYNSRQYGLVPIEVKSGNNAHLKSLQLFMLESSSEIAIRFWNNSFSVDDITLPNGKQYKLFNLPYYYAGSIEPILNKYSIKD